MTITVEQLAAIRKHALQTIGDDAEARDQIEKSFAGLTAAVASGDTVSADDLADIIGDVVVTKQTQAAGPDEMPQDPLAPIFVELHKQLFDNGQIRKGLTQALADELIQKAYEQALGELDGVLQGAVEATAIELGLGDRVNFGKSDKKKDAEHDKDKDGDWDSDDDGDDDVGKALRKAGVSPSLIQKFLDQGSRLEQLETERDLQKFQKMADDIGEGAAFAVHLMKMHQAEPGAATEFVKRMKAKNAVLKQANLMRELGGDGDGAGGSAIEQLYGHASEMVKKGEADDKGKKLTFAKAFTRACELYPDLYRQYQQEQARR